MFIISHFTGTKDPQQKSLAHQEIIQQINNLDVSTLKDQPTPPAIADFFLTQEGQEWYAQHPTGKVPILLGRATLSSRAEKSTIAFLSAHADYFTHPGGTPLHAIAMEWEDTKLASEVILKLKREGKIDISAKDSNGMTALHYAAKAGKKEIVEALLKGESEELLFITDGQGKTPFHWAMMKAQQEICQLFLAHKTTRTTVREATMRDDTGYTVVDYAHRVEKKEMARLLGEKGLYADDLKLYFAVANKDENKVRKISATRKDLFYRINTQSGLTPLALAAKKGNLKMVDLLLTAGCDPNVRGRDGITPLIAAIRGKNKEIVQLLLEKGADPNMKLAGGQTALSTAEHKNLSEIIELLKTHGAIQNIDALKFLTGIWGITLDIKLLHLSGGARADKGSEILKKYMKEYLSECAFSWLSENLRTDLLKEIASAQHIQDSDPQVLAKKIQNGETVFLHTGWAGHTTSTLFMTVNRKIYLLVGNRGEGTDLSGVRIYKVENTKALEKVLKDLKKQRIVPQGTITDSNKISEQLQLQQVEDLPQKHQKVSNCWFVNLGSGFRGDVYMHLLPTYGPEKALAYAKEIHKGFVVYARKRSTEDYLQENPGSELPLPIRLKKEAKYPSSTKSAENL
jgi:ankyrin repeat protein